MIRAALLAVLVLLAACGDDDAAEPEPTTTTATTEQAATGDAAVLLAIEDELPDALEAMGRAEWLAGVDAICEVAEPMDDTTLTGFVDSFYSSPILDTPGVDSGDQLRAVVAGTQVRCPAVGERLAGAAGL